MRWLQQETYPASVERLVNNLSISRLLASLLVSRGLDDPEMASRFLNVELSHLHDPFLMLGMDVAVRRIFQAIDRREKILIYGDYDVDGAMAVVILQAALKRIGADANQYIPDRFRDGYGMREKVIEDIGRQNVSLIITVDTGIRAFAPIERARELGIDCIVTDHHIPGGPDTPDAPGASGGSPAIEHCPVPRAAAVLNPQQANCPYPNKNLCGAGVALKLAQALLQAHPARNATKPGLSDRLLLSFLKPACIATIADSVPLAGENRVIVKLGLDGLRAPVNHGLRALIEAAGLEGKGITAWDVGFRLAPRLNAAGRMESAQDVIELFTNADNARAKELASKLNRLNQERQRAEQSILAEIEDQCGSRPQDFSDSFLVLSGEGWHRGVLGIVASRVVERFRRPALIISIEDGAGHGSGRSPESFHLLDALTSCESLFDRFGGHARAAGFRIAAERVPALRQHLNEYAGELLGQEDLAPQLRIDAAVRLSEISDTLLDDLERLAPFGCGNPRPVFCCYGAPLMGRPRLIQDKHLKLRFGDRGKSFEALAWRKASLLADFDCLDAASSSAPLDIAFSVEKNHYQGQTSLQLELLDWSFPLSTEPEQTAARSLLTSDQVK